MWVISMVFELNEGSLNRIELKIPVFRTEVIPSDSRKISAILCVIFKLINSFNSSFKILFVFHNGWFKLTFQNKSFFGIIIMFVFFILACLTPLLMVIYIKFDSDFLSFGDVSFAFLIIF